MITLQLHNQFLKHNTTIKVRLTREATKLIGVQVNVTVSDVPIRIIKKTLINPTGTSEEVEDVTHTVNSSRCESSAIGGQKVSTTKARRHTTRAEDALGFVAVNFQTKVHRGLNVSRDRVMN